jgi:hypothetical protein
LPGLVGALKLRLVVQKKRGRYRDLVSGETLID